MRCRLHPGHPGHRNKYIVVGRASNNNGIENTSNVLMCLIKTKLMKAHDYDFFIAEYVHISKLRLDVLDNSLFAKYVNIRRVCEYRLSRST